MEEFIAFEITSRYLYIQTQEKNLKILQYNFNEEQIKLMEIIERLRVFHCGENSYYSRKLYNMLFKHTNVSNSIDKREMFNFNIIHIKGKCSCSIKSIAYYKGSYRNIYLNHHLRNPTQQDIKTRQLCKKITYMEFINSIKDYCTKYDRLSKYLHDLLRDYVNQNTHINIPVPLPDAETDEFIDYLVDNVICSVNIEIEITKILKTVINKYREILLQIRIYIEKEFTKLILELQSNGCRVQNINFNFEELDEFTFKVFQMSNIPN